MASRRPQATERERPSVGAQGFGRAQVAEVQRARILTAMVQVACERGAGNVSVAHVVERCGVSRRTFYEAFEDREDCFLEAFKDAVVQVAARVAPAYETEGRWHERVRAALIELLAFLQQEPLLARLVLVESLSGGPRVLARRNELIAHLTRAVDEGRGEAHKGAQPGPLTAEGVIGGVSAVLSARVLQGEQRLELLALTGPLMSMIVLPYLGAAAARREASRTAPQRPVSVNRERNGTSPLHDLGIRLTYRTMRVLSAVASNPGASNRRVGLASGITDQGQISKLLGRLKQIGLVENAVGSVGQGAPNAWSLTTNGQRVVHAIGAHTQDAVPNTREIR